MAKVKNSEEKAKTRRSNGDGSIYQRKDDLWVAQIQTNNKAKYFYGKQRKDVVAKLKAFKLNQLQGYDSLATISLNDYIENWLTTAKKNDLKPASYDRLESTIKNQIIPRIGHYVITDLTGPIIQSELINAMMEGDFSHSSIKKAHNAINACLKYAVTNRQIMYNPTDAVIMPSINKFEKQEITIFTDEEIRNFEATCVIKFKNGKYVYKNGYGFILILYTGIRMGEALALKWGDIDFTNKRLIIDNNIVQVRNRGEKNEDEPNYKLLEQDTTKSIKGVRYIPLSKKAHNALIQLKKDVCRSEDYIFKPEDNKPLLPRNFRNTFDAICRRAGIKETGLHTLRHTFASLLFKKGVDVKTVSELLGHADTRITYNTYIHLIEEQKTSAIDLLDDI